MLKSYQGMDLEIPYPDSWMVSEEKQNDWVDAVTLESPESSFLSINRYPKAMRPRRFSTRPARRCLPNMKRWSKKIWHSISVTAIPLV